MPALNWLAAGGCAIAGALLAPAEAAACTVASTSTNLGSVSSYTMGTTPRDGSGSAGLQCNVTLAALTTHYIALRVDTESFQLTGPGGRTIPFTASLSPNGAPLLAGNFTNLSSLSLVSLFAGNNSSVPLYLRVAATPALQAGTYTGSLDLRWYYSVCSVGVLVCLSTTNSPSFVRPGLGVALNWGTGAPARVNVQLTIENDCIITTPVAAFGSAPLVSGFDPITRTILIRCSAGAAYTVGLDDGSNPAAGVRRMRSGASFLQYEIYRSATSDQRWGTMPGTRRSSATADANAGTYDSIVTQGFTFRAAVLPGQATPPAGVYSDTVRIDVAF